MPPRSLRAPRHKLDLRALAAETRVHDAEDAAPAPATLDGLPLLRLWSLSSLGGVSIMGVAEDGSVQSVQVIAYASDGTWACCPDGQYLRLEHPWLLPLATGARR